MLPWKRPKPHVEFEADARVLLDRVRKDISTGKSLPDALESRSIWSGTWKRRQQQPGLHKRKLAEPDLWQTKCNWCEQIRECGRDIDVEHYRPKAKVTEWRGTTPSDPDTRPTEFPCGGGYWWLAFRWDNFTLACKTCNQHWKRNLFPVRSPRPPCTEGVEILERPLLLDPASDFSTREHFSWDIHGKLTGISDEARATILTCGLNRTSLRQRRGKAAHSILTTLRALNVASQTKDRRAEARACERLVELTSITAEFTSMTRWWVEQEFGRTWDTLDFSS